jgi:hypothetical protein
MSNIYYIAQLLDQFESIGINVKGLGVKMLALLKVEIYRLIHMTCVHLLIRVRSLKV